MPRISAPTVVEHRARQRAALLTAATDLAVERGIHAVTFRAVAEATGLARNSVYEYFGSTTDLVTAMIADAMDRWEVLVREAMDTPDPDGMIRGYVAASLHYAAAGAHRLTAALADLPLNAEQLGMFRTRHAEISTPLTEAFVKLGVGDPARMVTYTCAIVDAAGRRIETGADLEAEITAAGDFVVGAARLSASG